MDEYINEAIRRMSELDAASKRIGEGVGGDQIAQAEQRLGISFPVSFKRFLSVYGWGGPDGTEIYGLSESLPDDSYPNLIRKNMAARTEDGLPDDLLVFATSGDGGYYALTISSASDDAVRVWYPGSDTSIDDLERSDESFGEWLIRAVEDAIELRDI